MLRPRPQLPLVGDDSLPEPCESVGESIEARYRGRSKYYPGKIGRVHSDGTFDIDYDDGEKERGVQRHLIRSMERPSSNAMSSLD